MRLILSSFCLFLGLWGTLEAQELECVSMELKTSSFGKAVTEKQKACTNKERTQLLSLDCQKDDCPVYQKLKGHKASLAGMQGSPGFKLCESLGGEARFVEFKPATQWFKLDQCRMGNSFVDTSTLLGKYYQFKNE